MSRDAIDDACERILAARAARARAAHDDARARADLAARAAARARAARADDLARAALDARAAARALARANDIAAAFNTIQASSVNQLKP